MFSDGILEFEREKIISDYETKHYEKSEIVLKIH